MLYIYISLCLLVNFQFLTDPHWCLVIPISDGTSPLGSSHLRCRRVMVGHQISTSVEKFASGKITAILLWKITMERQKKPINGPCAMFTSYVGWLYDSWRILKYILITLLLCPGHCWLSSPYLSVCSDQSPSPIFAHCFLVRIAQKWRCTVLCNTIFMGQLW